MAKGKKPIEVVPVEEERVLISWQAPARLQPRRSQEFWSTVGLLLGVSSLILLLLGEWFLILALVSLVFLYWSLTRTPPPKINYKLTTKGVYLGPSQRFDWQILRRFWLSNSLVLIETHLASPRVVSLVTPSKKQPQIIKILRRFLPFQPESPRFLDRAARWLNQFLPEGKNEK